MFIVLIVDTNHRRKCKTDHAKKKIHLQGTKVDFHELNHKDKKNKAHFLMSHKHSRTYVSNSGL